MKNKYLFVLHCSITIATLGLSYANASNTGISPQTSILVINESDKEGSIGVKNNNSWPVLLYAKILRLEDDTLNEGALIPPPPVLVPPGETQIVRVRFRSNTSLDKEHMARILLTGVNPEMEGESKNTRVNFGVGYDLPIMIRPKGYRNLADKWRYLHWSVQGQQLCVTNETKSVIRFVNDVILLPGKYQVTMTKSYALPGSKSCTSLPAGINRQQINQVKFSSITDYTYAFDTRVSPVN